MSTLRPFNGLLPAVETVAQVAAVPYDVISSKEAAKIGNKNPLSFLHISKPEINIDSKVELNGNEHSELLYHVAAEQFERICKEAPLKIDQEAHVYLYRLTMGTHSQTGIAGSFAVDEYLNQTIKRHEKTRKDKEEDRTRHVMSLRSQTGPVFLTYRDVNAITSLVDSIIEKQDPLFDFVTKDSVHHEFWRVSVAESIQFSQLFKDHVEFLYIADGHHRCAADCRAAQSCRKSYPSYDGNEAFNFFLAVAFPSSQLHIMPYNRVVKDLNGFTADQFLEAVGEYFKVEKIEQSEPKKATHIHCFLKKQWYRLIPNFEIGELDFVDQLDVSILQNFILDPLLGIEDPRTSENIDFVGGILGIEELEKRVNSKQYEIAFALFPPTLYQLMKISDNQDIMPPKSTWFEPKLLDGLVCHNF